MSHLPFAGSRGFAHDPLVVWANQRSGLLRFAIDTQSFLD